MLRAIVAVVVTFIIMFVFIVGTFMGLWYGMGPDRLLQPGLWTGNLFLCIAAPGITVIAGLLGGWLCAKIGGGRGPVMALAAVVVVLGATSAAFTLQKPEPSGPRPAGMTVQQIMEQGREPTWLAILNPIIGAAAVLIGGLCIAGTRKPR